MKITEDGMFVLIEASKLSQEDAFMKHKPRTEEEEIFKERLVSAIRRGVKDFYRPRIDPSFTKDGNGICYKAGKKPAVGKSYDWWDKVAKKFNPARKSRLGTMSEYVAFLGVLIKTLVAEGWSVEEAWDAVCNDSKTLGHYRNSEDTKQGFEPTGSREVYGFFDLSNAWKILSDNGGAGGFWWASGNYHYNGYGKPLADLYHDDDCDCNFSNGVGWIVYE
ncbi:MAG: hypothetical protein J6M02_05465 [Clostridia bacterium]|nr:hypothetical protein [Clostridia bacterium]